MGVLAGFDFSETSSRAAEVAARLAAGLGTPLWLVHVREPDRDGDDAEKQGRGRALEQLEAEAARLRALGCEASAEIALGTPDEKLVALARERKAELVVVAALGRRAATQWQLGSTAERVAQASASPVLVVRDARPFERWARGERPLRVTLGADFTRSCDAAARWLAGLRRIGRCEVTATHLYWPPQERHRLGVPGPLAVVEPNPEIEAVLSRDLRARLEPLAGSDGLRTRVALGLGRPSDHLISWAEKDESDLLLVGRHARGALARLWRGSVSEGVLHHATMSVCCVPYAEGEEELLPELRRILVPVDFSRASGRAVRAACGLARPGTTVILFHAIGAAAGREGVPREGGDLEVAELRAKMRALVPAEAERRGIPVQVEIAEAPQVGRAIVQAAERLGVDLVCVGGRGRSALANALLGSAVQEVLRSCARPVMVVPPSPGE